MINAHKNLSIKKGYQYLIFKIAAFLLLAFVTDFIFGGILRSFYYKQTSGWEFRTRYSIESTNADILIFGASRAQQQYNPLYFEDRLQQTCYNVGRDGEPLFYYYALLKGILKRYVPKTIILDIENGVFKKSQDSYDRMAILLPFYRNHPEMRSIIELRSPFEKLKLQSQIYPYNSMLFKIAMGNTEMNKKRNLDVKGYVELTNVLDEPIRTVNLFKNKYAIDSNKINFYRAFIQDCKQAHVKLYIVCSPYFMHSVGTDTSMTIAKQIAGENNIDFVDFSKDEIFLHNSKLFDDTVHVNVAGSKIFSNKLIDTLILKNRVSE